MLCLCNPIVRKDFRKCAAGMLFDIARQVIGMHVKMVRNMVKKLKKAVLNSSGRMSRLTTISFSESIRQEWRAIGFMMQTFPVFRVTCCL